jgi:hypothetical protein
VTDGVEVEVKLSVSDPAAIRRLIDDPDPELLAGFRGAEPAFEQVVVDRYIDTPDGGRAGPHADRHRGPRRARGEEPRGR